MPEATEKRRSRRTRPDDETIKQRLLSILPDNSLALRIERLHMDIRLSEQEIEYTKHLVDVRGKRAQKLRAQMAPLMAEWQKRSIPGMAEWMAKVDRDHYHLDGN